MCRVYLSCANAIRRATGASSYCKRASVLAWCSPPRIAASDTALGGRGQRRYRGCQWTSPAEVCPGDPRVSVGDAMRARISALSALARTLA
jgi:hypothetical protein